MSTHVPGFQSYFYIFSINLYWPKLATSIIGVHGLIVLALVERFDFPGIIEVVIGQDNTIN